MAINELNTSSVESQKMILEDSQRLAQQLKEAELEIEKLKMQISWLECTYE